MDAEVIRKLYPVVNVASDIAYAPFDYPAVGGGTSRFGEINLIRTTSHNGNFHAVGFWRVGPGESPLYDMPLGDETGLVLEGRATIEFLDRQGKVTSTAELRAGDVYTYEKGTLQRWRVHEAFRKFVIVVDDQPAG